MSDTGYKGISRIDDDERYIHGFLVRVGWKGELVTKFVSDASGNIEMAIKTRNQIEKSLGKPRTEKWIRGISRFRPGGAV